jgi:6-phospho-3-hexuloisomerase
MIKKRLETVFTELAQLPKFIDEENMEELLGALTKAKKIAVLGAGRSALALKMVAMRLRHLGLDAYVAGETISPALGEGDLLLVASGSGKTESTCAIAKRARANGATVWALTGTDSSPLAEIVHGLTILPTATNASSVQFGGSLPEACIVLLGDALVLELMERLGQGHGDMMRRHTNLE